MNTIINETEEDYLNRKGEEIDFPNGTEPQEEEK